MDSASKVLHYRPTERKQNFKPGESFSRKTPGVVSPLPHFPASIFFESDGDRVKRPMNSFLLWSKMTRKKYARENPNMHNAEISKLLGKIWNEMREIDKQPFAERAERLRTVHMRHHPNYRYTSKKHKEIKIRGMISSETSVGLRSNFFDINKLVNSSVKNEETTKNQDLKSFGYLQSACVARRNSNKTKLLSDQSNNNFSHEKNAKCSKTEIPLGKESVARMSKCNYTNIDSKQLTCKETATCHHRPIWNQPYSESQSKKNSKKGTIKICQEEKNEEIVDSDDELAMFFQELAEKPLHILNETNHHQAAWLGMDVAV